jgi:hypothetical protein
MSYQHKTSLIQSTPADESIQNHIYSVRGHKVMLDRDLAKLYGVTTKALNQAVQRNLGRFPGDFAFHLTSEEITNMMSQSVTSSSAHGGIRKPPRVFTELGIAMLSSVLQSERAITVNIAIMRAFVRLRNMIATDVSLAHRVDELEQKSAYHDGQLTMLFDVVHKVINPAEIPHRKIPGFIPDS